MVKIKWVLISAALITAIAGAFASNQVLPCESLPQYYKFGNSYFPAGNYGYDYYCTNTPGNCTYYQPSVYNPNVYAPCRTGTFTLTYLNK